MARARILRDSLEVRMILLGKTGAGKSSLGNTILDDKKFKACPSSKSITKTCAVGNREFKGKTLTVVDTPGFFDTDLHDAETRIEIGKSYQTIAPGPHVFLLVLTIGRFTVEEQKATEWVTAIFQKEAIDYCFIVFTGLDKLMEEDITIDEYLAELEPSDPLSILLDQCGRRYIAVNNKGTDVEKERTVVTLLNKIDDMILKNGGRIYTTPELEAVDAANTSLRARGEYQPVNSDGSIILYNETRQIVDSFLRRSIGMIQRKH